MCEASELIAPVAITVEVPAKRVMDLLMQAFEGGSLHWMRRTGEVRLGKYTKEAIEYLGGDKPNHYVIPLMDDGYVVLEDVRVEPAQEYRLGHKHKSVRDGLTLFVRHAQWANFVDHNEDCDTGDAFLQLCIFGEVRYK